MHDSSGKYGSIDRKLNPVCNSCAVHNGGAESSLNALIPFAYYPNTLYSQELLRVYSISF